MRQKIASFSIANDSRPQGEVQKQIIKKHGEDTKIAATPTDLAKLSFYRLFTLATPQLAVAARRGKFLTVTDLSPLNRLTTGPDSLTGVRADPARIRAKTQLPDAANTIAILGDVTMIGLGLFGGFWIRFRSDWIPMQIPWLSAGAADPNTPVTAYFGVFALGTLLLLITFLATDVYNRQNLLRFRRSISLIARALIFWLFTYLGVYQVLKFTPDISRGYVLVSCAACGVTLLCWRWFFHRMLQSESIAQDLRHQVLFVGWSQEATRLFEAISTDPSQPYRLLGCMPMPGAGFSGEPPAAAPRINDGVALGPLLATGYVDVVILAEPDPSTADVLAIANLCERQHVQFKVIASYFQILASGLELDTVNGVPIMGVSELTLDRIHNKVIKRTVDLIGSTIGLLLSIPVIVICGLFILIESPGTVIFGQERVGRAGRRFRMYKLRSMKEGAERADHLNQSTARGDRRVLRIGRFLRRWNLDELPQFWNVLRGDMSLVGPRPERTYHSEKLSDQIPHYQARHNAKPGMTGWAQVHGLRGDTDLAERVRYDLWYLENWSLWLDLQILVMTFLVRKNAY